MEASDWLVGWNPCIISASLSMSEALMLQAFRLDHLSVRGCEQWPHTWTHCYAVWGGEWAGARKQCARFWWWSSKGKGQFGGE